MEICILPHCLSNLSHFSKCIRFLFIYSVNFISCVCLVVCHRFVERFKKSFDSLQKDIRLCSYLFTFLKARHERNKARQNGKIYVNRNNDNSAKINRTKFKWLGNLFIFRLLCIQQRCRCLLPSDGPKTSLISFALSISQSGIFAFDIPFSAGVKLCNTKR